MAKGGNAAKAAVAGKGTTTKPPSPKRSKKTPNMREKLLQKKGTGISVVGFDDSVALEVYDYTVGDNKAGYIHNFRKWSKGEIEYEELTEANFIGLKAQRNNEIDGNERLKGSDGYLRWWMIRYPPDNKSTPETRQEGLRVLKNFFTSSKATNWPEGDINVQDATPDVPPILEKFFLDDDIEEIVKASFHDSEMNDDFYEKYTSVAKTFYLEKDPSHFAKSVLGFPSL
jgi:hypothetical protein